MQQIKSKERVRDLAEVFTNEREINSMLDLIEEDKKGFTYRIATTFLEPSCGTGNFLIKILERKLEKIKTLKPFSKRNIEKYLILAISTMYGVDISKENVVETRARLRNHLKEFYDMNLNAQIPTEGFYESIEYVLKKNIILGDMLEGRELIFFSEFKQVKSKKNQFQEMVFALTDMESGVEKIVKKARIKEYYNLHRGKPQPCK
jgi:transcription-repair coupling factor (superfamily II helicase)